jgi:hypothetical protein
MTATQKLAAMTPTSAQVRRCFVFTLTSGDVTGPASARTAFDKLL